MPRKASKVKQVEAAMKAILAQPDTARDFEQVAAQAIEPEVVYMPPPPDSGLFDDLDDEAEAGMGVGLAPYTRPDDGLAPLDTGLTPSEKAEFVKLLNSFLPLRERALQLAKLAMYTDTKRAAVGLRAIQEINAITGMSGDAPSEVTPMFALPADTRVNISMVKVVK